MKNFLRKMMQSAGKVVEKVGNVAASTKSASKAGKKENPEESVNFQNPFPAENQLRKWIEAFENKEIPSLLPNLSGKQVLQITSSGNRIWESLQQKGAESIIDFDVGHFEGSPPSQKPPHLQMIKGNLKAAPFPSQSIDYLILLGAGVRRENPLEWMKEISRVLKDGSRVILSFIHPFIEYRFNPSRGIPHRFDEYFMALKKSEIYVEEIRECLADESLKSSLGLSKNDKNFAQVKELPLLLIFGAVRLKRR